MNASLTEIALALRQFETAVARRRAREDEFRETFEAETDPQEIELRQLIQRAETERDRILTTHTTEFESISQQLQDFFAEQARDAQEEYDQTVREAERHAHREQDEIDSRHRDSEWVVSSVMDDTADDSPRRQFERFKQVLLRAREEQTAEWTSLDESFRELVERRRWRGRPPVEPADPPKNREQAQQRFQRTIEAARIQQSLVESLQIPKLFAGFRPVFIGLALTGAAFVPTWLFVDPRAIGLNMAAESSEWIGLAAGAAVAVAVLLLTLVYSVGAFQFTDGMRRLQQLIAEAGWVHRIWLTFAKDELQKQQEEFEVKQVGIERQRQETLERYNKARTERLAQIEGERSESLRTARQALSERLQILNRDRAQQEQAVREEYERRMAEARTHFSELVHAAKTHLEAYLGERHERSREMWAGIESDWQRAQSELSRAMQGARQAVAESFPPWRVLDSRDWQPSTQIPWGMPFGEWNLDLTQIAGAVPEHDSLSLIETTVHAPAIAPFPESPSLLIKTNSPQSREAASRMMQSTILRWLTSLPAGKLRLTILDPVGLGEAFSGFMHLADQDELLINSRIWTESGHIESRLTDLTQHMENVLQTYLRNEFPTIEAYNEFAGEVAEPYHLLVVAGFPHKFTETSAKRLASIIQSGPKCGVYTLIQWDTLQTLPHTLKADDVEQNSLILESKQGAFYLRGHEYLSRWPIEPASPPESETFTRIVRKVGELAKHARRVEVSFTRIAPRVEDYWTQDSRRGIDVPLGRAGATKLQHLRLGKGTSQHMLIAGKTGSGKSTFLHALITNLALQYSPREINFFLIDFKKGVEFKDYATFALPHARVIAIESDREFGVSALQRLDEVLQERGELFRREGVQDIAAYRDKNPAALMPRIMLVIDEFQEFFVEDDRVSQTAALLLDRLIRQGRAFGVHVVLGSQTLAGAYTLARSTLGQVAVRVALQCSEADAHLILSEENTAARLLTRPGEAIYNDANGLVEGNHPFQVAWLRDDERDQYLSSLQKLTTAGGFHPQPAIVFEGNVASDPATNPKLVELLAGVPASVTHEPIVWLGEAVEIKPPTLVRLGRHSGCNLLLVGANGDEALGVMSTALVALVSQLRGAAAAGNGAAPVAEANRPHSVLLDGSQAGSWEAEQWTAIVEHVGSDVERFRVGKEAEAIARWHAEVIRRDENREQTFSDVVLFVFNLSRFRELRKAEDDYGLGAFGSDEAATVSPGKQFAEILAKGPELGMHVVCWCDSGANVERWFSRQTMKEFELRVCFQMNASDSSNLIDSPAASKLGTHRAILYRDADGTIEKFRPYRPPTVAWLKRLESERTIQPIEEATDLDSFALL